VKPTEPSSPPSAEVQRQHAEQEFAGELAALAAADDRARPPNWKLSPWAVRTYVLGGKLADGFQIKPKYVGNARLIEIAVATLATDRALLLLGVPGTAKSWVAEHLAAAISGDSTLLVQGTAGTDENALRYGWNYARLLADRRRGSQPTTRLRNRYRQRVGSIPAIRRVWERFPRSFLPVFYPTRARQPRTVARRRAG
jgi:AAA domain (dynein-related subfamily)